MEEDFGTFEFGVYYYSAAARKAAVKNGHTLSICAAPNSPPG